jgi:hypothetical protein
MSMTHRMYLDMEHILSTQRIDMFIIFVPSDCAHNHLNAHSSTSQALSKYKVVWAMSQVLNCEKMTLVIHFYEIYVLESSLQHSLYIKCSKHELFYRFLDQLQLSNGKCLSMHPETWFDFSQLSIRLLMTT